MMMNPTAHTISVPMLNGSQNKGCPLKVIISMKNAQRDAMLSVQTVSFT